MFISLVRCTFCFILFKFIHFYNLLCNFWLSAGNNAGGGTSQSTNLFFWIKSRDFNGDYKILFKYSLKLSILQLKWMFNTGVGTLSNPYVLNGCWDYFNTVSQTPTTTWMKIGRKTVLVTCTMQVTVDVLVYSKSLRVLFLRFQPAHALQFGRAPMRPTLPVFNPTTCCLPPQALHFKVIINYHGNTIMIKLNCSSFQLYAIFSPWMSLVAQAGRLWQDFLLVISSNNMNITFQLKIWSWYVNRYYSFVMLSLKFVIFIVNWS